MSENRWDLPDVPHKGWICIDVEDLGADLDCLDAESRKDYYETCEMCEQEGIRYVHIMTHSKLHGELRVGCKCAERMEDDNINPQKRESDLINRMNRRKNFLIKEWTLRGNGNYVLKYKGSFITIMPSKYVLDEFGIACDGIWHWKHNGKKIKGFDMAKRVAFEYFD